MIAIVLILSIVLLLLSVALYTFIKKSIYLNNKEKELIVFVIDMYLSYGESLDIFPSGETKKILIDAINNLKTRIDGK